MKRHTLTLTLAAVFTVSPALAADWAHNDPDKASTGKVEIWDGSKTVTVNSAPSTAVATMGGGIAALGGIVQSQLSFSQFIAANDLDAANWKDITYRGAEQVPVLGSDYANKTGINTVKTIYEFTGGQVENMSTNSSYTLQRGESFEVTAFDKYIYRNTTVGSNDRKRCDWQRQDFFYRINGGVISFHKGKLSTGSDSYYSCSGQQSPGGFELKVLRPIKTTPQVNHYIKVNG